MERNYKDDDSSIAGQLGNTTEVDITKCYYIFPLSGKNQLSKINSKFSKTTYSISTFISCLKKSQKRRLYCLVFVLGKILFPLNFELYTI